MTGVRIPMEGCHWYKFIHVEKGFEYRQNGEYQKKIDVYKPVLSGKVIKEHWKSIDDLSALEEAGTLIEEGIGESHPFEQSNSSGKIH